jgi:hypothetical protein
MTPKVRLVRLDSPKVRRTPGRSVSSVRPLGPLGPSEPNKPTRGNQPNHARRFAKGARVFTRTCTPNLEYPRARAREQEGARPHARQDPEPHRRCAHARTREGAGVFPLAGKGSSALSGAGTFARRLHCPAFVLLRGHANRAQPIRNLLLTLVPPGQRVSRARDGVAYRRTQSPQTSRIGLQITVDHAAICGKAARFHDVRFAHLAGRCVRGCSCPCGGRDPGPSYLHAYLHGRVRAGQRVARRGEQIDSLLLTRRTQMPQTAHRTPNRSPPCPRFGEDLSRMRPVIPKVPTNICSH